MGEQGWNDGKHGFFECTKCGEVETDIEKMYNANYRCPTCGGQVQHKMKPTEVCDFCNSDEVVYSYDCASFAIRPPGEMEGALPTQNMMGGWACCADCSDYIERDDRAGLLKKVLNLALTKYDGELEWVKPMISGWVLDLHAAFFANRIGPRLEAHEMHKLMRGPIEQQ